MRGAKLTYEYVRDYIASFGYELLSKEYNNCMEKLKIKCDKGHEYESNFSNFKEGHRCRYCFRIKDKLAYEHVRSYVASFGYELLSEDYINSRTNIKIKCDKGHEYTTRFTNFKSENRCPICHKTKTTYEDVKVYIELLGYKLLSEEYINMRTKLKIKCDKGHEYEASFNRFKLGNRCPTCAILKRKLTYEYVRAYISSFGYELLSKEYKKSLEKLKIRCDKGHEYDATFDSFKSGCRCPYCNMSKNPKVRKTFPEGVVLLNIPVYDSFAKKLENYGHKCSRDPENELILNVECAYCGKTYMPTRKNVWNRLMSISGNNFGENNLYCSNECKEACPVYGQIKYRKGESPHKDSRFGDALWRKKVLERDNYTCQRCGLHLPKDGSLDAYCITETLVEAHHIEPVACAPAMAADIDNGITLCINCHNDVHHMDGCTIQDIKEAS